MEPKYISTESGIQFTAQFPYQTYVAESAEHRANVMPLPQGARCSIYNHTVHGWFLLYKQDFESVTAAAEWGARELNFFGDVHPLDN